MHLVSLLLAVVVSIVYLKARHYNKWLQKAWVEGFPLSSLIVSLFRVQGGWQLPSSFAEQDIPTGDIH